MKILSFENTKENFWIFFWYFAHLIVSLSTEVTRFKDYG